MKKLIELFDNGDEPYLKWIRENPRGFVINRFRSRNTYYRMLHTARCRHITILPSRANKGGFTERQYVKECGTKEELLKKHPKASPCRVCDP